MFKLPSNDALFLEGHRKTNAQLRLIESASSNPNEAMAVSFISQPMQSVLEETHVLMVKEPARPLKITNSTQTHKVR
jgi:hypothetical protein